jgi:methionyl-tRNA formyltransferase
MAPRVAETYSAVLPQLGHELAGVVTPELAPSDPDLRDALTRLRPEIAVCNGWSFRISAATMSVPEHGIVNGHPSKLPRWRGPNPFGWTLRANDPELGFTWHRMDADFDTGAVLAQGSTPLRGDETLPDLAALLPPLAAPLLARALARVEAGDPGDPQTGEATYAGRFEDAFAEIDWTKTAREVFDQCRCWATPTVSGIMGPLTTLAGERVRVLEASLDPSGDGVLVDCADGPLRVVRTEPV